MEKGRFEKRGEGYPIFILGFFAWISLDLFGFVWASSDLADGAFARASELGLD
jgi:hypothetical protein